jgi:hypothetical protein
MGGALRTLHSSRTAKYLLPILSENTKRSVMQKVEEEARETGLEIPPTFKNFNAVNEIIEEKVNGMEDKIVNSIFRSHMWKLKLRSQRWNSSHRIRQSLMEF